mmetsp:Transcript_39912/g.105912  ORF Transcript_39912/g.105912 Transcript_39912/m.105912 type:complete len:285 (-) Transcript_39912:138-992(-)
MPALMDRSRQPLVPLSVRKARGDAHVRWAERGCKRMYAHVDSTVLVVETDGRGNRLRKGMLCRNREVTLDWSGRRCDTVKNPGDERHQCLLNLTKNRVDAFCCHAALELVEHLRVQGYGCVSTLFLGNGLRSLKAVAQHGLEQSEVRVGPRLDPSGVRAGRQLSSFCLEFSGNAFIFLELLQCQLHNASIVSSRLARSVHLGLGRQGQLLDGPLCGLLVDDAGERRELRAPGNRRALGGGHEHHLVVLQHSLCAFEVRDGAELHQQLGKRCFPRLGRRRCLAHV